MDLRVGAYAVITDDDDRVLLAHWNAGHHSAWTMPGGGLEPGEDPPTAAHREVDEETGYRIELDELLDVDSLVVPAERRLGPDENVPLHLLRIIYRAHIVGGSLRDEVGGSTDRAGWFPLAAVPDLRRVTLVDIALSAARLIG
ncbi:NUDIX hydrolase [Gordonia crocea]|uniref:Nudix hydrolase domain-containing protein n=1 Tax=Gordonia crocea TaxID=589162 RepID=A0A7I9V0M5_9ACTN|nr:NUDIX hydrolase [Gordonia crocea]GED98683.1 hypothetical protein nbrc107697_27220 [Gordonia crocea]